MNKFEKEYFNGKISAYKGGYSKANALIFERLNLVRKYKNSGKLLDVGCAYGYFIKSAQKYFDCYGFDISRYAIQKAKRIVKTNLKVASAEKKWPYRSEFFDVITMWDIIEHLKNPKKAMKEAKRCIKKNGFIFIQTPNKWIRNLIGDKDKTHVNKHNNLYWRELFSSHRFKIIENYSEFPSLVGKKDLINKILRFIPFKLGTNLSFVLKNETN